MNGSPARVEQGRRYRWQVARRPAAEELRVLGDLDPLLAHLLRARGLTEAESARRFLGARDEPFGDPFVMAGMDAAVQRLQQALAADELIAIYGDYDVDGLTATAVLSTTLRRLGARVRPFIPHREQDGYGLRDGPLAALRAAGASLVVTVDCGVTAVDEIARARQSGLDVIVTDHHPVPAELPAAAVLNPNRADCPYPFKHLAGVGVAFRLAEALLRADDCAAPNAREQRIADLLELVAIGTLADVVPLVGENRSIVARGLARLSRTERPGLRALLHRGSSSAAAVDAERVCFALVPRLNAAGRLDDAALALELLLAETDQQAAVLVDQLEALNSRRRSQTAKALAELRAQVSAGELGPAILVSGSFPSGLAGPLASRLAEEFDRPTIVLRHDAEICTGSARSVAGFNVVEAIGRSAAHLTRFGGHAMAAGLSLRTEHLDVFRETFQAAVAELRGPAPTARTLEVDAELRLETAVSWRTLDCLRQLQPHGAGNPAPVFLSRGLRVVERRALAGGRARLRLAGTESQMVGFASDGPAETPGDGQPIDAVYRLRRNVWRGTVAAESELLDWRPAAPE